MKHSSKPLGNSRTEQKNSIIHDTHDNKLHNIRPSVDILIQKLIECASQISNVNAFYKKINISSLDLYHISWIRTIVNHKNLFADTSYCKSSAIKRSKVIHIYYNVFERLLFELDLFHLFFAYDICIDNHSPWDNLNPSSLFVLCGNLQKLYEKTQPTQREINLFFTKSQRFYPILKYKYVNSENWKQCQSDSFVNVNADIDNDFNYASRILHPQLFDTDMKQQQNGYDVHDEKHADNNNQFSYQIFLQDKEENDNLFLIHSETVKNTFNVHSNEELSRNMTCPSLYLSSGHVLSARKWIPDSDLYGTIMIKCHDTIMIMKSSALAANGAGYTSHYGLGHGAYYKEAHVSNQGNKYYSGAGYGSVGDDAHKKCAVGGQMYGEGSLAKVLHFGSPSGGRERGGGIIELIAKNIVNYGKIACDGDSGKQFGGGSGGSIKIVCCKFINYGKITAQGGKGGVYERKYQNHVALRVGGKGGGGRIAIYCEQYVDKGSIIPQPAIIANEVNGKGSNGRSKFKFDDNIPFTTLALAKDNQFYG